MTSAARAPIALLIATAMIAGAPVARADDPVADPVDEGDAPDVEAPRAPEVKARVGVIVLGQDGEPLPAATRGTLQVSMERALERDRRLEVVDQDTELARRAGEVPAELVSEARGLLGAGEALLRRGQAKAALAKLKVASARLRDVLAWAQKAELARAQFLLGAAYAVAGEDKAAIAELTSLLAWRPGFVADTSIAPGEVMPLWEKAEARAARLPGGSIEIRSSPGGAMAYVDGKFVGFTPTVVEALPVATHYVTVRMHGRVRSVSAVEVSARRPASLDVSLEPTPGVDRLVAAIGEIARGVGVEQAPARMQGALGDLSELLEIDHAVILVAPDDAMGTYAAHVYTVEGGTRLATTTQTMGERDPEVVFAQLARGLYDQISFEPLPPPEPLPPARVRGTPFYRTWWFWTTVGAVVAASVAVPLYLGRDTTPEIGCPAGESCGVVIFSF